MQGDRSFLLGVRSRNDRVVATDANDTRVVDFDRFVVGKCEREQYKQKMTDVMKEKLNFSLRGTDESTINQIIFVLEHYWYKNFC